MEDVEPTEAPDCYPDDGLGWGWHATNVEDWCRQAPSPYARSLQHPANSCEIMIREHNDLRARVELLAGTLKAAANTVIAIGDWMEKCPTSEIKEFLGKDTVTDNG